MFEYSDWVIKRCRIPTLIGLFIGLLACGGMDGEEIDSIPNEDITANTSANTGAEQPTDYHDHSDDDSSNNTNSGLGPLLEDPPFAGSIYVDSDIIRSDDPTAYLSSRYKGRGFRFVYDRRSGWVTINAYLFDAYYDDGFTVEFQVNPEFDDYDAAVAEVETYAPAVGRVPSTLRTDVASVTIHKGEKPHGGGNRNILIHTGQTHVYTSRDILEETLMHEAAHVSLDGTMANSEGWLAAQAADNAFITEYAEDHPGREDVAESFLFYLAVRYRSERISQSLYNTIMTTIPNRIAYFDQQDFQMYPIY
jgi:hypothetical protein